MQQAWPWRDHLLVRVVLRPSFISTSSSPAHFCLPGTQVTDQEPQVVERSPSKVLTIDEVFPLVSKFQPCRARKSPKMPKQKASQRCSKLKTPDAGFCAVEVLEFRHRVACNASGYRRSLSKSFWAARPSYKGTRVEQLFIWDHPGQSRLEAAIVQRLVGSAFEGARSRP